MLALLVLAATAAAGQAGDWPQFRGPTGQGHASDESVPLTWSETENVVWKIAVPGRGWSSPVIADGLVWLTTATAGADSTDDAGRLGLTRPGGAGPAARRTARTAATPAEETAAGGAADIAARRAGETTARRTVDTAARRAAGTSLRLLAYDLNTGESAANVEVFTIPDTRLLNQKNSFASPTPVLDPGGERVYVHFGAQGTAAVAASGERRGYVLWRNRFPYTSQHGNGGSPILHDGLLIASIDGYDTAFLVAMDGETGEERWRFARPAPISQAYSTPLAIRVEDAWQIVGVSAFRASAHEPATGREIWRVEYPGGFSNVSRPVYGHGLVYLSTGFNEPVLLAVRPTGEGNATGAEVVWRQRRGAPLTVSPLLVGDALYTVTDGGVATCIDALTGEIRWQHRLGGNHSASPVHAGGRIYLQSEDGVTTVISPGPRFEQIARNELDGRTLASLAVADGAFFIRTDTHLYRIEEAPRQSP